MRILIAKPFNKAVEKLTEKDQKSIYDFYSTMSLLDKKEIFDSRSLIKVSSTKEKIYTAKVRDLRIFCTFESDGENEDLIFLDVMRKATKRFTFPFQLKQE